MVVWDANRKLCDDIDDAWDLPPPTIFGKQKQSNARNNGQESRYTHDYVIYSTCIPSDSRSSAEEVPVSKVLIRIEEDLEGGKEASSSAIRWEVNYEKCCIVLEHEWWKSWKYLQGEMWKWYLLDYVT